MRRILALFTLIAILIMLSCGESGINIEGVWFNFTTADGLASNLVFEADEATDGTIWLATYEGASHFLADATFANLTTADGLPSDVVLCLVCGDDGRLWLGTDDGLAIYDGSTITTYTTADGLPSNEINTISLEDADTAWVGTADAGICRFVPSVSATTYDTGNSDLPSDIVWDIVVVSNSKIIIATNSGAAIFTPPDDWQVFTVGDGLVNDQVFCAYPLGETIWFGTNGGASKYEGGTFTSYTPQNSGLSDSAVSGICADNDGDPMWFATLNGGVNRFENGTDWRIYGPGQDDGPLVSGINSALCTTQNIKWFGTNGGGASRFSPYVE